MSWLIRMNWWRRSGPVWGASYRLLQTVEGRQWRQVISPALALEYESVLKRGAGDWGVSLSDVDDFTEYLCSRGRLVQIYFRWLRWRPMMLRDQDGDRILEAAIRTGSPNREVQCEGFPRVRAFGYPNNE